MGHFLPSHQREKIGELVDDSITATILFPPEVEGGTIADRMFPELHETWNKAPVDGIPVIDLPREAHEAYECYLMLLMTLRPNFGWPAFLNVEKAQDIANRSGLSELINRLPREVIEESIVLDCTTSWGDGWEPIARCISQDATSLVQANDLGDQYREMMDWAAGAGYSAARLVHASSKVQATYDRLNSLLMRLRSEKEGGGLDQAYTEARENNPYFSALGQEAIWFEMELNPNPPMG